MAAPKLRFKEFDGDLAESKLVDSTSWASGGTPAKNIPEYWGDDIPLISGASMHTNQLYESDVKITKLGLQKGSKLAPKDSILILVRGSMLFNKIPMGITLGDVAFNQDVKCIRPKQELAPLFLFQWLYAKENTIQNKVTATGIGAGKLDTADLQNLKLYKPSSEEQTKIASFLSAVDEKISQLTQKHALLSQYKQGMMQKLFSQQIRFKAGDGSEFGKWENKTLGDIADIVGGGTPSTNNEEYWNGNVAWLTPSEINKKFIGLSKRTISEFGVQKSSAKKLPIGTVLFTSRATIGEVAISTAEVTTNQGFQSFIVNSKILNEFLYYWIVKNKQQFIERASGSTFLEISKSKIQPMKILLPCIEEQTKIANFLSAIDKKIEVVAQQIDKAKTWKKGLLQQMFV